MRPSCPNSECKNRKVISNLLPVVRNGWFRRIWDKARIQRYLCRNCRHAFSDSTFEPTYREHKPYLNLHLLKWFASSGSQRRGAVLYEINLKTVALKFETLAKDAMRPNELDRRFLVENPTKHVMDVQFDEMESTEHTKLKPLSIPIVVESKTRKILGFEVCKMPAKGLLARKSRKKYGPRPDERNEAMNRLFSRVSPFISPTAKLVSDSCPRYASHVKRHFPKGQYRQVMSRTGCVTGQGELKKGGRDPMFWLNHTAAMIRANVNRTFRRTWCTTKKPISLYYHLEIYTLFHNRVLIVS